MPLIVSGTTIKSLKVNNTTCKKGVCNNVTVFNSLYSIVDSSTTPNYGTQTFNTWTENTDTNSAGWVSGTATTNGNVYTGITKRASNTGFAVTHGYGTIGYNAALILSPTTISFNGYTVLKVTYYNTKEQSTTSDTMYVGAKTSSGTTDLISYRVSFGSSVVGRVQCNAYGATTTTYSVSKIWLE